MSWYVILLKLIFPFNGLKKQMNISIANAFLMNNNISRNWNWKQNKK